MKTIFSLVILLVLQVTGFSLDKQDAPVATVEVVTTNKGCLYSLDHDFYGIAGKWVRLKEGIGEDELVRITIRGLLASIGVKPDQTIKAHFLSDPRPGKTGPLLYLSAPKDVHLQMAAKHKQITGSAVEEVKKKQFALIEELRKRLEEKQEGEFDPFAAPKQ